MAWNRCKNVTNAPPPYTNDIYKVMSFNTREVCFIKVPFCTVEWISTESGYFRSTLSAIPWRHNSTALQKIKTPLLNLLQASRFWLFTFPSFFLFLHKWILLTKHLLLSLGHLKHRHLKYTVNSSCNVISMNVSVMYNNLATHKINKYNT